MSLSASLQPLFNRATVSTAEISAAVAQVKAAGVVEANLRPLVDAFAGANREGRVSATSRKAFEAALFGLVKDLPRTPSSVVVRRDEAGLASSIQQAQGVIGKQTSRIASLEAEVQTLSTALTTKKSEADNLLITQTNLEDGLATALAKQQKALETSILFAMCGCISGAGAFTVAATINGVSTALSIGETQTRIAAVKAGRAQTLSTVNQLANRINIVNATMDAQRQSLDGLKLLETSLRAQAATITTPTSSATLSERLNGLAVSLEVHQSLSNNLGKQIEVLESMKAGLSTANVELDALIVALKADNDGLRKEIASTERAIKSSLIDMALSMSNVPGSFKLGALDLSTKTLLLDGVEGLRLSMLGQAHAFANNTITSSVLGVPSSSPVGQLFLAALKHDDAGIDAATAAILADATADAVDAAGFTGARGRMMLSLLNNDPGGVRTAAISGILDNVDSLTAPQRYLVEQLLFSPSTAAAPLSSDMVLQAVTRVVADASIDEPRARAIAHAVATTDKATLLNSAEPILHHLERAADVLIAEATPATTKLVLTDATDASLGRMGHLSGVDQLVLFGSDHTSVGLKALSSMPSLAFLQVSTRSSTSAEVRAFAGLQQLQHLQLKVAPKDIATLAALPSLYSLRIVDGRSLDDTALNVLSTFPALTKLGVSASKVTGTGIAASSLADRLTRIELEGTTQSAADLKALSTLPKLNALSLGNATVVEADLHVLAASSSLQTVSIGAGFDPVALNAAVGRNLFV